MDTVNKSYKKVLRYIKIYGVARTLTKIVGRLRPKFKLWAILSFPKYMRSGKRVGLIGCGHHAFSSIAYYLTTSTDSKLSFALDVDQKASSSLAYAYNVVDVTDEYTPGKCGVDLPDIVYISSNHATHTQYAVEYLSMGCDVYIEKPISINYEQLNLLSEAVRASDSDIFVGYNRPHSPSIGIIRKYASDNEMPFTLSCFITGHFIPDDHWYRDPAEGTRVVSNLGHWIDLTTHILFWSSDLPEYLDIVISYSNLATPSDNIIVSFVSSRKDLINMTFTSRSEPFEGVNESINFQQSDLIAKIDDFRTTKIWKGDMHKKFSHWPKNNGHKAAVLQPFRNTPKREWDEIEQSTRLMLHIEDMVINKSKESRFVFSQ